MTIKINALAWDFPSDLQKIIAHFSKSEKELFLRCLAIRKEHYLNVSIPRSSRANKVLVKNGSNQLVILDLQNIYNMLISLERVLILFHIGKSNKALKNTFLRLVLDSECDSTKVKEKIKSLSTAVYNKRASLFFCGHYYRSFHDLVRYLRLMKQIDKIVQISQLISKCARCYVHSDLQILLKKESMETVYTANIARKENLTDRLIYVSKRLLRLLFNNRLFSATTPAKFTNSSFENKRSENFTYSLIKEKYGKYSLADEELFGFKIEKGQVTTVRSQRLTIGDYFEDYYYTDVSNHHTSKVKVEIVDSKGKLRGVTKSDRVTSLVCSRIQRIFFDLIFENKLFEFTSSEVNIEALSKILRRKGKIVSGDYTACTDRFDPAWSEEIVKYSFNYITGLKKKEKEIIVNSFRPLICISRRKRYRLTTGQLMGHCLSFPLLCIINLSIYIMSRSLAEQEIILQSPVSIMMLSKELRINGDDIIFHTFFTNHRKWKYTVTSTGLEINDIKTHVDEFVCNLNSHYFVFICGQWVQLNSLDPTLLISCFFVKHMLRSRITRYKNMMPWELPYLLQESIKLGREDFDLRIIRLARKQFRLNYTSVTAHPDFGGMGISIVNQTMTNFNRYISTNPSFLETDQTFNYSSRYGVPFSRILGGYETLPEEKEDLRSQRNEFKKLRQLKGNLDWKYNPQYFSFRPDKDLTVGFPKFEVAVKGEMLFGSMTVRTEESENFGSKLNLEDFIKSSESIQPSQTYGPGYPKIVKRTYKKKVESPRPKKQREEFENAMAREEDTKGMCFVTSSYDYYHFYDNKSDFTYEDLQVKYSFV